MRSRYAAFALKEVDYLLRTLHADHPDRDRPAVDVLRELRDACRTNRYMALRILDTQEADPLGVARVVFSAKVFRRGHDLSFVERSEFLHDGEGWRYVRGEVVPPEKADAHV
jgi:SEC-C motif-containing protein